MSNEHYRTKMDKGWPLPEDHLPEGRVCVQFEIPDDRDFAAIVVGHIFELGKWWNWEKGGGLDRRATETAQLFRTAIHETLCVEKYREMGCKCEDKTTFLHRVTADGGLEISKDGGATWTPDPSDPRVTAPQLPPLPGSPSDDKRCQSASNVRWNLKVVADQLVSDLEAGAGLSTLVGTLIGLLIFIGIIGSGGALTPILLAIGAGLFTVGATAFNAAMTDAVWDTFECIVYCHMGDDGKLKANGINKIKADITAQLTGIAVDFLTKNVELMGEVGINNMAATATGETGDCTDCGCGLCGENWLVGYYASGVFTAAGTLIDSGENVDGNFFMTVQSFDRGDGAQTIRITTPASASGCHVEFVADESAGIWNKAIVPNGTVPDYFSLVSNPLWGGGDITMVEFLGHVGAPYQVTFTFTAPAP